MLGDQPEDLEAVEMLRAIVRGDPAEFDALLWSDDKGPPTPTLAGLRALKLLRPISLMALFALKDLADVRGVKLSDLLDELAIAAMRQSARSN
jgi:hypothetical protein